MPDLPSRIQDLAPAPYNPRAIGSTDREKLSRSMKRDGDLSGIVFNLRTGNLVGGHQRTKNMPKNLVIRYRSDPPAPDERGDIWADVVHQEHTWPIRIVDWDIDREKAANIKANAAWLQGGFTEDLLSVLEDTTLEDLHLDPLTAEDIILDLGGTDDQLDSILGPVALTDSTEPEGVQAALQALQRQEESGREDPTDYRNSLGTTTRRKASDDAEDDEPIVYVRFGSSEEAVAFKKALGLPGNTRYVPGKALVEMLARD